MYLIALCDDEEADLDKAESMLKNYQNQHPKQDNTFSETGFTKYWAASTRNASSACSLDKVRKTSLHSLPILRSSFAAGGCLYYKFGTC